jgi:hypothetical protein
MTAQLEPGVIDLNCALVGSSSSLWLMIHVKLERSKSVLESFLVVKMTSALRIPELASVVASATRLHQNRQEAPLVTLLPNLSPVDLITRKRSHCRKWYRQGAFDLEHLRPMHDDNLMHETFQ